MTHIVMSSFGIHLRCSELEFRSLATNPVGYRKVVRRTIKESGSFAAMTINRSARASGSVMSMDTKNSVQRPVVLLLMIVVLGGCGVRAKTSPNLEARVYGVYNGPVCLLAGEPPSNARYEVLGKVVATKRTYGSPDELYGPMVREARRLGADALINLQAGQRFKG